MQRASYIIEVESGDFVEKGCRVDLPLREFPVNVDQLIVLLKSKRVLEKTATKDNLKITAFFAGSLDKTNGHWTVPCTTKRETFLFSFGNPLVPVAYMFLEFLK